MWQHVKIGQIRPTDTLACLLGRQATSKQTWLRRKTETDRQKRKQREREREGGGGEIERETDGQREEREGWRERE